MLFFEPRLPTPLGPKNKFTVPFLFVSLCFIIFQYNIDFMTNVHWHKQKHDLIWRFFGVLHRREERWCLGDWYRLIGQQRWEEWFWHHDQRTIISLAHWGCILVAESPTGVGMGFSWCMIRDVDESFGYQLRCFFGWVGGTDDMLILCWVGIVTLF